MTFQTTAVYHVGGDGKFRDTVLSRDSSFTILVFVLRVDILVLVSVLPLLFWSHNCRLDIIV